MVKISSCRKLRETIGSMCASVGEWMHGNNVSLLECLAKAGSIISCSDFIKCASVTRFLREAGCHSVRRTNTHRHTQQTWRCSLLQPRRELIASASPVRAFSVGVWFCSFSSALFCLPVSLLPFDSDSASAFLSICRAFMPVSVASLLFPLLV